MADKTRHPVAQGGFWSSQKASYSKETQNLLKEMMKESKLNNFQQRQLSQTMQDGGTLPSQCHPTTSAKRRVPMQKPPPSKIVDPRVNSPQIRSKEQIEATGAYKRDKYVPKKTTYFYEKDKERLANIMAYGEDIPPPDPKKVLRRLEDEDYEEKKMDRFDELQAEIDERRRFLNEMEALGQEKQFRPIIETEISQKIREMEIIDKKRTLELQKLIEAEEKKKGKQKKEGIPQPTMS